MQEMGTGSTIIAAILLAILAFFMIKNMRANPEWFSKANLSKAFTSMGFLALLLICFIAFLVFLLNMGA